MYIVTPAFLIDQGEMALHHPLLNFYQISILGSAQ
jgi:hypothetical protein